MVKSWQKFNIKDVITLINIQFEIYPPTGGRTPESLLNNSMTHHRPKLPTFARCY